MTESLLALSFFSSYLLMLKIISSYYLFPDYDKIIVPENDKFKLEGDPVLYFTYGDTEINYLKSKDKVLGELIDKIGPVRREVDTDLFSSVVHHIIGQQISTKAQATLWGRIDVYKRQISVCVWLS